MARPKAFDPDVVLQKAMTLFWQKGYASTSIQNLVDHLGIRPRSLYDTFTSKHDLFVAALTQYRAMRAEQTFKIRESLSSPIAIIEKMFEGFATEAVTDIDRKGCFFVNSAVELAGQNDIIAKKSKETYQNMELVFQNLLEQAQQAGELGDDKEIKHLAQYLTNAMFGIRVMAKMNPDKEVLTNVIKITLSALA